MTLSKGFSCDAAAMPAGVPRRQSFQLRFARDAADRRG